MSRLNPFALLGWVLAGILPGALSAQEFTEAALDASIAAHRQGDLAVKFVSEDGTPIAGGTSYALTRHHFAFGVAIDEGMFDPLSVYVNHAPKYLETIKKHFNAAVHEKNLKWHYMERARGRYDDDTPMKVWEWCRDNGIEMRGHCIFWGSDIRVPNWVRSLPKNELEGVMKGWVRHVMRLFKGRIGEYDVTNELLKEDWYGAKLGLSSAAPYFQWCREQNPDAVLYVNEWGALWGKANTYADLIQKLLDDGAPLGGIGIQAHFRLKFPDNETQWAALDRLAQFKLPMKITEFGVENLDEGEQAKDLRRLYKLYFAHPAIRGIYLWGFWEKAIYRRDAALWRENWTPRPSGEVLTKLMTEEWITKGKGTAGADGVLKFHGFYGDYTIKLGGKTYLARLTPEQKEVTASVLPEEKDGGTPQF